MKRDIEILRRLASEYFEAASSDDNLHRILLHKGVNDLKPIRTTLLIDEIPWHEMNFDGSLTLQCTDPDLRGIEDFFRKKLFQWKNMPGDMVLQPYFRVEKKIHSTGIGIGRQITDERESGEIQAHTFVDQLNTEEDLLKLHKEVITYDKEGTEEEYARISGLFGDILPVRICGEPTGYGFGCKTWDDIVNLRGLMNIFYDMEDRPEFLHKTVQIFTDIFLDKVHQYEELDLLDGDAYYNHCASALTNDLHPDYAHVKTKDVWGRGLAQILASVSPAMQDEFDTQYMMKTMEPFGLVYYGCCEPLDRKIGVISKIPHLRKISITPWANVDVAAEAIGKRYVMSAKPNPAILATPTLDVNAAKAELNRIMAAAQRNGCSTELLMKDITTVGGRPQNLFEWEKIAMEAAREGHVKQTPFRSMRPGGNA